MPNLSKYWKLLPAVVGVAAIILGRHFGETSWEYLDAVSIATLFGIYIAPKNAT